MADRRLVMATLFFPRGGSAHVARALATQLPRQGWDVTLASGSRSDLGPETEAPNFYEGLSLQVVDYTAALSAEDPLRPPNGVPPMHPSYEDHPGAPDRVFASVDDETYERLVTTWTNALTAAGAADADILYLHHLTPLHEAAARAFPDVPVIGHVHGTELLMLEQIDEGAPAGWHHAEAWAERLRGWAARSARLVVQLPGAADRAAQVLGVERERFHVSPNGFDPEVFSTRDVDRGAVWRRHLVQEPRGWRPGAPAGSVAYQESQLRPLEEGVVVVYVGRFTGVKRVPLLIRAWARAHPGFERPAALVLIGGHPGEWEGEHPFEAIEAVGARDVFLAGWHPHRALPDFFAAADAIVLPSVREAFGQVLVEGMACGLPALAVNRFGGAALVEDGETGWLVDPDDEQALAAALLEVVNDEEERARRSRAAQRLAVQRYSWPTIAAALSGLLEQVARDDR